MERSIKTLLVITLSLFALLSITAPATAAERKISHEQGLWDKTRHGATAVFEWSVEKSKQGWQATREIASDSAAWTGAQLGRGWQSVKNSVSAPQH